jgi:ribosomal protein S27AE
MRSRENAVERSLRVNGFVHLDGGLSIVGDGEGRRRFFQICPRCSSTVSTDATTVANYIQRYGCLECRTTECDREHAVKRASLA